MPEIKNLTSTALKQLTATKTKKIFKALNELVFPKTENRNANTLAAFLQIVFQFFIKYLTTKHRW